MLSNWTKAETTTTGTGTLTLTAVTGFPRPADACAVGTLVQYSLVAANGDKESGVGKIAAAHTLERTQVTSSFVAGVYDGASASAITLPAGTHEVIVTPMAAAHLEAALFPFTSPTNSVVYSGSLRSTQSNSTIVATEREIAWPFLLMTSGVLTDMSVNVATAAADSTLLLGIYEVSQTGGPGRRITKTTAAIDTSTTGFKIQAVTSVRVSPGWYWVALNVVSGLTPSLTHAVNDCHAFGASSNNSITSVRENVISADLSDPFPSTSQTIVAQNSPLNPLIGLVLTA